MDSSNPKATEMVLVKLRGTQTKQKDINVGDRLVRKRRAGREIEESGVIAIRIYCL